MNTKTKNTIVLLVMLAALGSYSFARAEISSGEWIKKEQRIQGSWSIETRNDGSYLVLDESFKTRNAPDLKFVLSKQSVADVTSRNAMNGGKIIALLKSNRGGQSYKLPDDFGDYKTLLLHCEQYSKLWGASNLKEL